MQASEGEGESDSMMRPTSSTAYFPRRSVAGNFSWRRWKGLIVLAVVIIGICIFAVPMLTHGGPGLRGSSFVAVRDKWEIRLISDMDKLSKVDDSGKTFRSVLQAGTLSRDPESGSYQAEFGEATDLFSGHNEAGRGMELSELLTYDGSLLTVDDRTGIVFEIREDEEEGEDGVVGLHMVPRYILSEGNGLVDKGMKLEWATVKGRSLVLGSMGKEYTDNDGNIVNMNNNWVIFIDENGVITREDWTPRYTKLREATGSVFPGYMIHESAAWSETMKKWVFCPRRISSDQYDDVKDEKMGSNTILITDENFRHVDVRHAGSIIPTHGFSSFKFVPGTGDQVIVALKSMEESVEDDEGGASGQLQDTYIMVFNLDGEVLLEETEVPGDLKFEGIEIMRIPAVEAKSGDRR